ncbi:hypothetical protein PLCT1_02671 [Planctomycetaceae bacterium]|nr:hypothetical protein PLCT1_02671 [Planctomycetaceae bacterium]
MPRALSAMLVLALFLGAMRAEDKASKPAFSAEQTKYIEKTAPKARAAMRTKVAEYLAKNKGVNSEDFLGLREVVARWFPELHEVVGAPGQVAEIKLGKGASQKLAVTLAKDWAKLAQEAKACGLNVTANFEALRAFKLDPASEVAATLLGYVKADGAFAHSRVGTLRENKLAPSEWGWLPETQLKKRKENQLPEGDGFVPAGDADAAHKEWGKARTLRYTFFDLKTNLPMAEASEIGRRLDFLMEINRARYMGAPGYNEPAWPLKLNVIATLDEYDAHIKSLSNGQPPSSPFGFYSHTLKQGFVCAEACRESFEKPIGIALHEGTHAFMFAAFANEATSMDPAYGWVVEGAAGAVYYITPEHPLCDNLLALLKQKFGGEGDPRKPHVDAILEGKDELGRLNKLGYEDASNDMQAYIGGAVFAAYCQNDDRLREAGAKLIAQGHQFKAPKGLFEELFGPSPEFSKAMGAWAAERAK